MKVFSSMAESGALTSSSSSAAAAAAAAAAIPEGGIGRPLLLTLQSLTESAKVEVLTAARRCNAAKAMGVRLEREGERLRGEREGVKAVAAAASSVAREAGGLKAWVLAQCAVVDGHKAACNFPLALQALNATLHGLTDRYSALQSMTHPSHTTLDTLRTQFFPALVSLPVLRVASVWHPLLGCGSGAGGEEEKGRQWWGWRMEGRGVGPPLLVVVVVVWK